MADNRRWRANLKRFREEKDWTLEQLARLAGCTKSQLSMLENGRRPFTQKTLAAIIDQLGIDFSDLFCGCSLKKRRTDPAGFNPAKLRLHHKVVPISSAK